MKKTLSFVLAVLMLASASVSAMAAGCEQEIAATIEPNSIAYMQLDEASSPETTAQVLAAREAIIFSHSWVADDVNGEVLDKDGNVKEVLPHFSELFPSDWEVPMMVDSLDLSAETASPASLPSWDPVTFFQESLILRVPSATENTPAFCNVDTAGFENTSMEYYIESIVTQGIFGNGANVGQYNVGYTNKATGKSLGFKENMENGELFRIYPPKNITVSVRASTYTSVGTWSMYVTGIRRFIYGSDNRADDMR